MNAAPGDGGGLKPVRLYQTGFTVRTGGQGHYEITDHLRRAVRESGLGDGLLTVFCLHTSCSLVLMENADPSAWTDLERFLARLAPEQGMGYTHVMEGPDDMPSHLKMALTRTSETIPVCEAKLVLGTWQGVFLWEHRRAEHGRRLQVTVMGTAAA